VAIAPGQRLGPYEILAHIGAGGMGVVYRARDSRLERDVAIKFLPPGILHDDAARRRFRKEAMALAKVNHQNIAAVFDVGTVDGADYLVMEYVPGESLAQKLKSGPLRPAEALSVGEEVARALEEAHEQGIIHRDLKPANIVITPKGHAKVLDFGLAKSLSAADDADQTLTVSHTKGIAGTPLYMSPEQARGEPIDCRTDLWGLEAVSPCYGRSLSRNQSRYGNCVRIHHRKRSRSSHARWKRTRRNDISRRPRWPAIFRRQ
jgi:serine/threonine protein kinase